MRYKLDIFKNMQIPGVLEWLTWKRLQDVQSQSYCQRSADSCPDCAEMVIFALDPTGINALTLEVLQTVKAPPELSKRVSTIRSTTTHHPTVSAPSTCTSALNQDW
ncbi:UNVERIFIED_CONTAM: hypothetical protein FKN15_019234 [Acipenser sinensis]